MPVYRFMFHDRMRDCDVWRYQSPLVLCCMWLRDVARERVWLSYRSWLYERVTSGDLITREFLTWHDEISV